MILQIGRTQQRPLSSASYSRDGSGGFPEGRGPASKTAHLHSRQVGAGCHPGSMGRVNLSTRESLTGFLISWAWVIREEMDFLMPGHRSPRMSLLHSVGQSGHRSSPSSRGGTHGLSLDGRSSVYTQGGAELSVGSSEINHMRIHRTEIFTERECLGRKTH